MAKYLWREHRPPLIILSILLALLAFAFTGLYESTKNEQQMTCTVVQP